MNIQLPDKFYYSNDWKSRAYVEDGELFVEGTVNYENLMYTLAYVMFGYNRCHYCGNILKKETRTLDHIYPRCWGGVSIPDNLVPCCSACNSRKSNMTMEQYKAWINAKKDKRSDLYSSFIKKNEEKMKTQFILPKEWVTLFDITNVVEKIGFEEIKTFGNDKIDLYYTHYGHYPRPIIVSQNDWVFKGIHILYHAKTHGFENVPCIRLDNVIRVKV